MRKHSIGSRLLSMLLAVVMVIGMVPAMQFGVSAALVSGAHGMGLTSSDKITMPIKIMDYHADGILFDYTSGRASGYYDSSDYKPETNYWADFTGTLTGGTKAGHAADGSDRNVRYGSGFDGVSLATTAGAYGSTQWINVSKSSLGGKQLLNVVNVKKSSTGVPTQWRIADFTSAPTSMTNIRYMSLVYRAYDYGVSDPKIGISSVLSEDTSARYASGKFSGWYHINTSGGINQAGDRNVDSAVIDLKNITASGWDKLYLDFPMNTQPDASGNLQGNQNFNLVAVAFFRYEADAHQFNHWASTLGCMSDTDSWTSGGSIPVDSYDNNNSGFSMFTNYNSTFTGYNNIIKWLAGKDSDGVPRIEAGQQPLTISGYAKLHDATNYKFGVWYSSGTVPFAWAGSSTYYVSAEQATGVKLYQTVGDTQAKGYATIGLVEPSLDENGYPVYKKGAMLFIMTYLRNCLTSIYEYELDGWRNYSTITGVPDGELYGYMNGGQVDHDPNTKGVQGVPMDLATALSKRLKVDRKTVSADNGTQTKGTVGSYEATMKKRAYLQGSFMDCKQYITTWWDAAYYLLNNLFVPDSYNELQSEYNYLNLYKSTNTSSDSYGRYVFDSSLTTTNASPYTTAVTYNTDTKTIGHSGASYKTSFNGAEAYNPFAPVNYGKGDAGESNKMYYLDDGVNMFSSFGGNLWYEDRNYGFSLACNGEFDFNYSKDLMFNFDGDDDVYLFINGELVLDMGGTHNNTNSVMYMNDYVDWARTVLKNREDYSLAQIARAEKLNLIDGETYSFDFYYMERQGTGANLRIETNIEVVVPELEVNKVASQNGVEVPDNGVVDNKAPVEYGFSLTNDGDTSKLYNIGFTDSEIGVTLSPENGLVVKYYNLVKDKDGGTLDASDLVAYVDGYDGDPHRNGTKKLDTVTVHFSNNDELKQFLTNLTSDDGTGTGATDSLYSGDGLWAYATVTIRGIYYTQTRTEQARTSFTNPVTATAYNGAYKLTGTDTHTVFAFGEPSYFMWAGHKITVDSEKLYEDLKNSSTYSQFDIPEPGHMILTLSDSTGEPAEYAYVDNSVGGDVYLTVNYPDPGMHVVYINVGDKTDPSNSFVVSMVIYALSAKDSAVVLDYGLTADLSNGNGMFNGDFYKISSKDTLNKVMAITGVTGSAEYVEQDVSGLQDVINTENNITSVSGDNAAYIGKFDTPVYLRHDLPWVIEWETTGTHSGGLMFAMNATGSTTGNVYLYTRNYTNGSEAAGNKADFIALGRWHNGTYDNHGIDLTSHGYSLNQGQKYRLQNRPFTDGTNKVVLFINDVEVGKLDTYWVATTVQSSASTFISGTDFTFNYMGTGGHPIDLTNLKYVNIYEDGRELYNYRWEATKIGDLHAVTTGEPGNLQNNLLYWENAGSASDTDGFYGALKEPAQLNFDKQWAVEFQMSGLEMADGANNADGKNEEVMVLVSTQTTEREYIYLRADIGLVSIGTTDAVGHHNFGFALKNVIPGFSMADKHTYRIENRINTDGTSMGYLIVDGEEIGPMMQEFDAGTEVIGSKVDIFTGNNLMFTHIGHASGRWPVDCTLHYLQVWEDTSLTGTYGWVKDSTGTLVDNSVTDANGNRINFTGDATHGVIDGDTTEGTIDAPDGTFEFSNNMLTFTPDKFLGDNGNSIKVALTVYDRDSSPTPLADKKVDIANEVQMYKNISIIPATVVYYEDDFVKVNYLNQNHAGFDVIGDGSSGLIQGSDFDENYGSDDAYDNATEIFGGNSLHQVPIEKGPMAYFTFQGTGFEIVASTNAVDSGSLYIKVFEHDANASVTVEQNGTANGNVSAGTQVAMIPVITEFDYLDDEGSEALYQIPVISWDSGSDTAKTYTAVIYGVPSYQYDDDGNKIGTNEKYLYLDGIRIYQPLGASNDGYTPVENNATFVKLSQLLTDGIITAADYYGNGTSFGAGLNVWTENHIQAEMKGHKVNAVSDYVIMGPNNEIYMDGTFTRSALIMLIKEDSSTVHDLQVAISAIDYGVFMGAGYTYPSVKVMYGSYNPDGTNISDKYGWKDLTTISSGTEQYYTIPYKNCPVVQGYYMVALQVTPTDPTIPALASFSNLKYNGMELASYTAALTTGVGETSAEELAGDMSYMMGSTILLENEAEAGSDFKPDFETTDAPVVAPKYPSLSFEDEIRYNVYFTAENLGELTGADMGLITFDTQMVGGSISNATNVYPGAIASGDYYVVSTDGISAKNLGDTLYFKVYVKQADGTYIYSDLYSYSAVEYAKDRLANSNNEELKALVVAMLNYGAEAQNYFGYKTDALMNSFLTAEQKAMVASYDASMVHAIADVSTAKQGIFAKTDKGFGTKYPSINFGGAFSINYFFKANAQVDGDVTFYYWTAEDYANADVLTAANASGKMTMTENNGMYMATVADIAAKDVNGAVYVAAVYESNGVACASGVLPYSLGAYCADRVTNGSAAMQSFASATAVYGYYAENYFAD